MHSRRSTDLEIAIRMQIELLFMFVGCLFVCFFLDMKLYYSRNVKSSNVTFSSSTSFLVKNGYVTSSIRKPLQIVHRSKLFTEKS